MIEPAQEPLRSIRPADDFGARISPFRHELLVHCYRMLGSIDDAEDAVQDALARAWNGRATYRREVSLRAWLYRIATNTCLDAIDRRSRRDANDEHLGVLPAPDAILGDPVAGPEAVYDARESVSLAFLTVLQVLPARQRAVLVLRDVLAWRAAEVADLLELSVPAVNSSLARARATVARRYVPERAALHEGTPGVSGSIRSMLNRYVRAWEAADIPGLVALLRDDAVVAMPPGVLLSGAEAIRAFLAASVFASGRRIRMLPVAANRGPAFVVYSGARGDGDLQAYAVSLVDLDLTGVARISVFADPAVLASFGVPETLAG